MGVQRRGRKCGMTLLELMFACGILALALSMIFGSLISITIMNRVNAGSTVAISTLSSVMEELNTLPFDQILSYVPPDLLTPGVQHAVTVELVLPGAGGSDPTTVPIPLPSGFSGAIPNPVEIRVTLLWQESSGHTFQLAAATTRGR